MDNLFIVMPAYNEAGNIEKVVRDWYVMLSDKGELSRLIVADNGSNDGTHEILLELQKELLQLEILQDTDKQHGPKVIALYDTVIKRTTDSLDENYIFQTDSDGQTCTDEFDKFWKMRKQYAAIIGNRVERGDGLSRKCVETIVCFLLRMIFGVKVPDANAPFRLMDVELVKKYLYKLPIDFNIPNIMMTTYFAYYNESVTYEKITFKPRQSGKNSINIPKIMKIGWKAVGDFVRLKKAM